MEPEELNLGNKLGSKLCIGVLWKFGKWNQWRIKKQRKCSFYKRKQHSDSVLCIYYGITLMFELYLMKE